MPKMKCACSGHKKEWSQNNLKPVSRLKVKCRELLWSKGLITKKHCGFICGNCQKLANKEDLVLGGSPKTVDICPVVNDIKKDIKTLRKRTSIKDLLAYHPRVWIRSRPIFCQTVVWLKKPRNNNLTNNKNGDVDGKFVRFSW